MGEYTKDELQQFSVESLDMLVQQGEITWSEWVDAQPNTYGGYDEWLQSKGLERSDENALAFIRETEEEDMAAECPDEMYDCMQAVHTFKRQNG